MMNMFGPAGRKIVLTSAAVVILLAVLVLLPQAVFAQTQTSVQSLTYDNATKQIDITYDSLGRMTSKTAPNMSVQYTYDKQYNGTLSNITMNGAQYNYEYDSRGRVTKETRIIDGIAFVRVYTYDSADRVTSEILTPGSKLSYTYGSQGQVYSVPGYVESTVYNAAGKPVSRTYNNSLVTQFSYDPATQRLAEIRTGALQQLGYAYDAAGNVLAINDLANNRTYAMTYDFLDRLVRTVIGSDAYTYAYNPIGSMLRITKPLQNMTFSYGSGPAHAPSQVVIDSATPPTTTTTTTTSTTTTTTTSSTTTTTTTVPVTTTTTTTQPPTTTTYDVYFRISGVPANASAGSEFMPSWTIWYRNIDKQLSVTFKMIDLDTGQVVKDKWGGNMTYSYTLSPSRNNVASGRTVVMPNKNWNVRFIVSHLENGVDAIDKTVDYSIKLLVPATTTTTTTQPPTTTTTTSSTTTTTTVPVTTTTTTTTTQPTTTTTIPTTTTTTIPTTTTTTSSTTTTTTTPSTTTTTTVPVTTTTTTTQPPTTTTTTVPTTTTTTTIPTTTTTTVPSTTTTTTSLPTTTTTTQPPTTTTTRPPTTTTTSTTTTTTTLPGKTKCWSASYQYLYASINQFKKFCKCATGTYGYRSYSYVFTRATVYQYVSTANDSNWSVKSSSSFMPINKVTCSNGVAYPTNRDYYSG